MRRESIDRTAGRWTRLAHRLRTEGDSAARQAFAIGVGLFIGCTPFYGFHLLLCALVGSLLGLNRLKLYVAANISNPILSPFLVFAEVQIGQLVRTGSFHPVTVRGLRELEAWSFASDLLIGSAVLGVTLGVVCGLATYALVRWKARDGAAAALTDAAAERYLSRGMAAWEFAHSKLRYDPVYAELLRRGLLPDRGRLLDLGCGDGLLLALVATAAQRFAAGAWPDGWPPPPRALELQGIDVTAKRIAIAREALRGEATLEVGDLRTVEPPRCQAIVLIDVLHYLGRDEQDRVLARLQTALEPGGVILIREADAGGGLRFLATKLSERLRALFRGHGRQRFHFRSAREWVARLEELGLAADAIGMGMGTPFANVLIRARQKSP